MRFPTLRFPTLVATALAAMLAGNAAAQEWPSRNVKLIVPYPAGGTPDPILLAAALDLSADDLGPHAPGVQEGGPRFLYAPLRSLVALARARVVEPHWSRLIAAHGLDSA